MDYDMKKPCETCPFRRGTVMRLREGRVEEIVSNMLNPGGGEFPCHKTIINNDDDEGFSQTPHTKHCAGALIFAEKNERMNQMMRFAERFGAYDPVALMADQEVVDSVFDDYDEMLEWLTQDD